MTQTITHHPDGATLMAYAAGSLGEALSAVTAGHVATCPACRREVELLTGLGGALLDGLDSDGASQVRGPAAPVAAQSSLAIREAASGDDRLPSPIARRYGLKLADVRWKLLAPGIWSYPLALAKPGSGELRLLKVSGGTRIPEHGHGGSEMTLVIEGGFSDATGAYGEGDVQDVDADIEHTPVADPEGCICLVASETPPRFKGLLGRLLWG